MGSPLSKLTYTAKDTIIIIVLDRSGSMDSIAAATINGFNEFLKSQKSVKGKAELKLIQFDDHYDVVHDFTDIQGVKDLTDKTFMPRGTTALYDAIGKTIIDTESYVSNQKNKPQILFVIITDGLENASVEYTQKKIFEMISEKRKDNWEFSFIGANQDSFAIGGGLGIRAGATGNYQATKIGTQTMYNSLIGATTQYRSGKQYTYDPDDQDDADKDND